MKRTLSLIACFGFLVALSAAAQDLTCELVKAAATGQLEAVKGLLAKGADPSVEVIGSYKREGGIDPESFVPVPTDGKFALANDMELWNAIEAAVEAKQLEVVEYLYGLGARIDERKILRFAVLSSSLELFRTVVPRSQPPEAKCRALGAALEQSRRVDVAPFVTYLLQVGVDVNGDAEHRYTVLDLALRESSDRIVAMLKQAGATRLKAPPQIALATLYGEWVNPPGLEVPLQISREYWDQDGRGFIWDSLEVGPSKSSFKYKVVGRDPVESLFQVVLTYDKSNIWYCLVRVSPDDIKMEIDALGRNQQAFPQAINPQSRYYSYRFRRRPLPDRLAVVGTWIDPLARMDPNRLGKVLYGENGQGGIFRGEADSQSLAAFTYRAIWKHPLEELYYVRLSYGPGNDWNMLLRVSPDGRTLESDARGQNQLGFATAVNPGSMYYAKLTRR